MNYKNLSSDFWSSLKSPDIVSGGYPSTILRVHEEDPPLLHLFQDRAGHYHFAIEASGLQPKDLTDPRVNGLKIQLTDYKFRDGPISQFIDLTCTISGYIEEFTEVVREISRTIFESKKQPLHAVNKVVNNWISFWKHQSTIIFSEESQIGLIGELITLSHLCKMNPENALNCWTGPLGEKHDFIFTDWSFEIKCTKKKKRIHTINGLEQLLSLKNKSLALISFMLSTSSSIDAINLPKIILKIVTDYFEKEPTLVVKFNELLAMTGYNPIHNDIYSKYNFSINDTSLFIVDQNFPKLTLDNFSHSISSRIMNIQYDIDLDGMIGIPLEKSNLGNYFT